MPQKTVGDWRGEPVHGAGGEWRYESPAGESLHVHPNPDRSNQWSVHYAEDRRGTGTALVTNVPEKVAFAHAEGFMRGHSMGGGSGGFSFGGGL